MLWYDVVFFVLVALATAFALRRVFFPPMSAEARAYRDHSRARNREALALTFTAREIVWLVGYLVLVAAFVAFLVLR